MARALVPKGQFGAQLLEHAVLFAILGLVVVTRSGTLLDDRTWTDEDYVLLEANGIHPLRAWPQQFHHSDVVARPRLSVVLGLLATNDVYPPVATVIIYSLRFLLNPIAAPRAVFLLIGLALILLVQRHSRSLSGAPSALVTAAYVAASPLLAVTSQQLKWFAIAPFLATVATLLVLRATGPATTAATWIAYSVTMALLLQTHYFGIWAAGGHALFVWFQHRRSWRPFLASGAGVIGLCAPWYVFGFPRQMDFSRWYFENLGSRPFDSWYQPLTSGTALASCTYSVLSVVGLQPSTIRVRYMLPLAIMALWCVYRCSTSVKPQVCRLGRVSSLCLGVAMAGQLAYSLALRNTIPLSASYFVIWAPLVMLAAMTGAREIRSGPLRSGVAALLLGFTLSNLVQHHYPEKIAEAASLGNYRQIANVLAAQSTDAAIVFRRDRDAKVTNLYYDGPLPQVIVVQHGNVIPPVGASKIIIVSRRSDPRFTPVPGWVLQNVLHEAGPHARLEVWTRDRVSASEQPKSLVGFVDPSPRPELGSQGCDPPAVCWILEEG